MLKTKRVRDALSDLETVHAKIDAQAHALHEAVPDEFRCEGLPPNWVYMFSTSVDELIQAGLKLVQAIHASEQ